MADYSLAAMQQIAKLISDSAAQDQESIRNALAMMAFKHGVTMDQKKLELAEQGQISTEESQDFRDALSLLTLGNELSFKDRQMDILEKKFVLTEAADERAIAEHELNIKNIKLETATQELKMLESVRAISYQKGVTSFYDDSGLMSLYSRHARDKDDDDDLGQEEAVKELRKKWGFNEAEALNITSAIWGYNTGEKKDPTLIGSIAAKVHSSLEKISIGQSTIDDERYIQAFQTMGYIDPSDESSLNAVVEQTGNIKEAGLMENLILMEMEQIAKGDYVIGPEVGMYTAKPISNVETVDPAGDDVPMEFAVGQKYSVQQLKDWGLDTNIKNQLHNKAFVEFALNTPNEAQVVSYTPSIVKPKTYESSKDIRDAFNQLELFQSRVQEYTEKDYQPVRKELHESFNYLKKESDLSPYLPTKTSYAGGRGVRDIQVLDPFGTPTEDDLRKLSIEAGKLSEQGWKPSFMKQWDRPIGTEIIQATEDYKSSLGKFKIVQDKLDQLKRMESDARANLSRIYVQTYQP